MLSKNVAFYGKKSDCEQLAYVLNIKDYVFVDNLKKYDYKKYILIICDMSKEIIDYIRRNKLRNKKDYMKMKYIYHIMNKSNKKNNFLMYLSYINKKNIMNIIYILRPTFKNINIINKIPVEFLRTSEMFIKTINSETLDIECNKLEDTCFIDTDGQMWGCCPRWCKLSYGNVSNFTYDSYYSRVIKLSSLNRTYCFCDFNYCNYEYKKQNKRIKKLITRSFPKSLTIAIDRSCNLKCRSCRSSVYTLKKCERIKKIKLVDDIVTTGWLEKSDLVVAGQGEVFFSEFYKKILFGNTRRKSINILTNGTLLNNNNWQLLSKIYKEIDIYISIDAATKETYFNLRGGNFDTLINNLKILAKNRNRIRYLQYNFVVQKDNYFEMKQFVDMAKKLKADKVQFTKLNNWGTFSEEEYISKSMIINDNYLNRELYEILKDPIFKDNKVDIESLEKYFNNSKNIYETNVAKLCK